MATFLGYHGTNSENSQSINSEGFRLSEGTDMRYGPGVYFFIDDQTGTCPKNNACNWVLFRHKNKKLDKIAVFQATILPDVDKIWDLRSGVGMQVFNDAREISRERLSSRPTEHLDYLTVRLVQEANDFQAIVGWMYIRTPQDSELKIPPSTVPNATVLNVPANAQKCIDRILLVGEYSPEP